MSLTTNERAFIPPQANRPAETKIDSHQSEDDEPLDSGIVAALHDALGLGADQAIISYSPYNTWHSDRAGNAIPGGGEMVIRVVIAGHGVTAENSVRYIEVRDDQRGNLHEEAISGLGLQALKAPMAERIVL